MLNSTLWRGRAIHVHCIPRFERGTPRESASHLHYAGLYSRITGIRDEVVVDRIELRAPGTGEDLSFFEARVNTTSPTAAVYPSVDDFSSRMCRLCAILIFCALFDMLGHVFFAIAYCSLLWPTGVPSALNHRRVAAGAAQR